MEVLKSIWESLTENMDAVAKKALKWAIAIMSIGILFITIFGIGAFFLFVLFFLLFGILFGICYMFFSDFDRKDR